MKESRRVICNLAFWRGLRCSTNVKWKPASRFSKENCKCKFLNPKEQTFKDTSPTPTQGTHMEKENDKGRQKLIDVGIHYNKNGGFIPPKRTEVEREKSRSYTQ